MTKDDWKRFIRIAAQDACVGNQAALDLLTQHLEEIDLTKEALLRKGYGAITGASILEIIQTQIPPAKGTS